MNDDSPRIVNSEFSGFVTQDGITVELCIYRLAIETVWSLELIDENNSSIVWTEVFDSDRAAYTGFRKALSEEGMKELVGGFDDLRMSSNSPQ